jgi:hypothetical protein
MSSKPKSTAEKPKLSVVEDGDTPDAKASDTPETSEQPADEKSDPPQDKPTATNQADSEEDEDEEDYRKMRRDMPGVHGSSAVGIVAINVSKKPAGKNEFFRVHPTFNPIVNLVDTEVGMDRHYFTATDEMEIALAGIGISMSAHSLYLTVSETGAVRVVPVRCKAEDGDQNAYDQTREMALIRGRDEWVRIYSDLKNQVYKVFPAPKDRFADPIWPALKHSKIFRLAFRDKGHRIDSHQHPIYMKWAGRAADKK